jgi:HK97 family phage portal protein
MTRPTLDFLLAFPVDKNATQPATKDRTLTTDEFIREYYAVPQASSGARVNIDTALGVVDVLACARVIAEGCAQVPLHVLRDLPGGGKERATEAPEYWLLHQRPNELQTSYEFRETLSMHSVLTGAGYAFKSRDDRGRVMELLPLMPQQVTVERLPNWTLRYHVTDLTGGPVGYYTDRDVFHLRGPSWNSISGLPIVTLAREAIGLAMAVEESQGKQHANGIRSPGFISFEGKQNADSLTRLRESWQQAYAGTQNHGKMPFLDNGATFHSMAQHNSDAQVVETRKLQTEQICRAFGVFPQMIGHSDKASTFASAEAFFMAHVKYTLAPWFRRWESTLDHHFFNDRRRLYSNLVAAGLLRGDHKARSEMYKAGITDGWMTRNEARALEDLNPLPGLDEPLVQQNMAYANGQAVVKSLTDENPAGATDGN